MAAFCGCCGAEITGKDEACRVCGTPRHGMVRADRLPAVDLGTGAAKEPKPGEPLGDGPCCKWP